ncbi:MAG: hypothetical protein EPN85_01485 [Bacteroidetes bacterium]|nr:MAG: hypothetical protein EPN85_01485 [Bacteroidota bacterium]
MKTDNDTIFFYGNSIPFNDGFDIKQLTNYQGFLENSWLIENVVFQLMNKNNFKIIGSNGKQVETVQIKKKKGKRPANSIYIVYSDNDTKEKLFDELLYLETPIE